MNSHPGVLGRKVGMTQLVAEDGTVTPVTVVEAVSVVVGKRTEEKNGYNAVILGIDDRKDKHTTKPLAGQYKNTEVTPKRVLREFRCDAAYLESVQVGQTLDLAAVFQDGQFVDVRGVSKGKGYAGVMKRHGFAGSKRSHGAHEVQRHGGSIGTNMTPGRVLPGRKMAGQLGNVTASVLNQKIARVMAEKGLVLIAGGIPGGANGVVEVRGAVKKRGGKGTSQG